jgi:glutaconate CoA-transferase, subunit A
VVNTSVFTAQPESTLVPHFMVEAFAVVPRGAWPGSCWPAYEIDYPAVEDYLPAGDDVLAAHLARAPEAKEARHV